MRGPGGYCGHGETEEISYGLCPFSHPFQVPILVRPRLNFVALTHFPKGLFLVRR